MLKSIYFKVLNFISAPLVRELQAELKESNNIIKDIREAIKPFSESANNLKTKLDRAKSEKDLIVEKLFKVIDETREEKLLINALDPTKYNDIDDEAKNISAMEKELRQYEFQLNMVKAERETLELKYKYGSKKILKMRESLTFEQIAKAIGVDVNTIKSYVQSLDKKNLATQ